MKPERSGLNWSELDYTQLAEKSSGCDLFGGLVSHYQKRKASLTHSLARSPAEAGAALLGSGQVSSVQQCVGSVAQCPSRSRLIWVVPSQHEHGRYADVHIVELLWQMSLTLWKTFEPASRQLCASKVREHIYDMFYRTLLGGGGGGGGLRQCQQAADERQGSGTCTSRNSWAVIFWVLDVTLPPDSGAPSPARLRFSRLRDDSVLRSASSSAPAAACAHAFQFPHCRAYMP